MSFNMKFDPFMKGIWEMVACDNRTLDSAIPPGQSWPCILTPERKEKRRPQESCPTRALTLWQRQPAADVAFSLQHSNKLILKPPFCFPETPPSTFHFTTQEKLDSLV